MADLQPLAYNPSTNDTKRLDAGDQALLQGIEILNLGADFTFGALQSGFEIVIGATTEDVRFLGNIIVDGNATVTTSSNLNGTINLGDGTGSVINIGGGGTDTVNLLNDLEPGAGGVGLGASVTEYFDELWFESITGSPAAVAANAAVDVNVADATVTTGRQVSGANAIGVGIDLLSNTAPSNGDLQTVLEEMDVAIGAGGTVPSLDEVMTMGTIDNTVALAVGAGIGEAISLTAAAGAVGAGADGFAGGAVVYIGGAGGVNDGSTDDGGVGGANTQTAGAGGAATGAGRTGGLGGDMTIAAGAGGDSASFGDGAGGALNLTGGAGGTTGIFQGAGGDVTITGGAAVGAGGSREGGDVFISPGVSGSGFNADIFMLTDSAVTGSIFMGNNTNQPTVNIDGKLDIDLAGVDGVNSASALNITTGASFSDDITDAAVQITHNSTNTGSVGSNFETAVRINSQVAGSLTSPRYPLRMQQASSAEAGVAVNYGEMIQMASFGTGPEQFSLFVSDADPNTGTGVAEGELGSLMCDAANQALYIKTGATTWEAFTIGGAATLQEAYEGGRAIAVGSGTEQDPMSITNADNGNGNLSLLTTFSGGGNQIDSTMGALTTGDAISIFRNTGATGVGLRVQGGGSGDGIFVDKTNALGVGIQIEMNTASTEAGLDIDMVGVGGGSAHGIDIAMSATSLGNGINLAMLVGSVGSGLLVGDGAGESSRYNLDSLRTSVGYTFSTDNATGDGVAGPGFNYLMGNGSAGIGANNGGSGGGIGTTMGIGGTSGSGLGGNGGGISLIMGVGGVSATGQSGNGGGVLLQGGVAGDAAAGGAGNFAGVGGGVTAIGGVGGLGFTGKPGRAGGAVTSDGGVGGGGTASDLSGDGGANTFNAGAAGADGGGGLGTDGVISIGVTTASAINLGLAGASGNPTTVNHAVVSGSPAAGAGRNSNRLDLADATVTTGRQVSGANSIGVGINLLTNSTPGNGDLQTVLEALDVAAGGGGVDTLANVIETGTPDNTVSVDVVDASAPIIFTDNGNALTTAAIQIVRSGAGAGEGLLVTKSGAGTTPGLHVDATSGTVGDAFRVTDTAGAIGLSVTAAGNATVGVDGATTTSIVVNKGGDLDLRAGDDQDINLVTQNASGFDVVTFGMRTGGASLMAIDISSTTVPNTLLEMTSSGSMEMSTSAAGTESGGDITIEAGSTAAGATGGNARFGATAATGTAGQVEIRAGGAGFTSPGGPGDIVLLPTGGLTISAGTQVDITVGDNQGSAFLVQEGANEYIRLDTTDGSELVRIGDDTITTAAVTVVSGATGDITFDARGATTPITVNESGDTDLDGGFSGIATSIIGALNALLSGSVSSPAAITVLAGEAIQAGSPVSLANTGGVAEAFESDANSGDNRENAFGIAPAAIADTDSGQVVMAGEIDIPDAAWAAAEGGTPAVANVGQLFYMAIEQGHCALDAPSAGGNRVLKLGIISRGGTGAVRGIVPVPDSIKL